MIARTRRRRGRPDDGAAAVEFALVSLPLLVILFGIIDYGIWFSDSISARQAVRDAARRAVVENFDGCKAGGAGTDTAKLACSLKEGMDSISGTPYVKITMAPDPAAAGTAAWATGATLRVCAITKHDALLPLVPFPAGGISRTRVDMPIEQATLPAAAGRKPFTTDPDPSGQNWAWCP